ncbi:alpha/beta hydrolase [Falsiroseomonas sp.]|uniref:alpha/beta hydrolase n=1 Tax=Falsiroseomonas sp. TaxID=2870721 RepID=UPI003F71AA34
MHVTDVIYHPEGLPARLYQPEGPGRHPAVVSVHGGAWTFGDRMMNAALDGALAEAGVLVMAPEMRKPPAHRYPASVEDIRQAIAWLKAQPGVGPVGGLGTSSGGHQVMLAALRPEANTTLAFVAVCWGVLDPLARYRMAQAKGLEKLLAAHHAWWPDAAAMEDGSPQHIVERGEALPPPTLLIQGDADANLTPDMAQRFAATCRARGAAVDLRISPGRGHLFITEDPQAVDSRAAIAAIAGFVHAQAAVTPA